MMTIILTIAVIAGYFLLDALIMTTSPTVLPVPLLWVFYLTLALVSFYLSTRLWKWYDQIVNVFSRLVRIIDVLTWGLIFVFALSQYQKELIRWSKIVNLQGTSEIFNITNIFQYINFYTWGGLTSLGFVVVGLLRLFIKENILAD